MHAETSSRRNSRTFEALGEDPYLWDTSANEWAVRSGAYRIMVGDSSRNLPLAATLHVAHPPRGSAATLMGG
ncbi:MAG: hypothetical protein ACRDN9_06035 [Streptosporangiaceae bacterium]